MAQSIVRWRQLIPGMLALSVGTAARLIDPAWLAGVPVLCPFRRLTGVPCPGCGLTRAVVALAHGDVAGAVALHPLALPAVTVAIGILGVWVVRGQLPRTTWPVVAGALALVLAVWAVRLPRFLAGEVIL